MWVIKEGYRASWEADFVFVGEQLQGPYNPETRIPGFYYVVNIPVPGGIVRIGKIIPVFFFFFCYKRAGSSVSAISFPYNTSMAPEGPITAISAEGQA